ncbi:MAG: TRAM domain-containing protein [Candidatus Zapsychrus exili]|nr:TRAM domain-containing protein [Candidatus Zapsychrus exili]
MTLSFIRSFFLALSGLVGYYIGFLLQKPVIGAELGFLSGLFLIFIEQRLHKISVRGLSAMVFGFLLGIFMAKLLSDILALLPLGDFILSTSRIVITLIFSYLGAVMALRGKDEFNLIIPYVRFRRQYMKEDAILLDTSAIIDGRIIKIYKTNFLAGQIIVPQFVLLELQQLADSKDEIKRQKGRRGLELLKKMQEDPKISIRIHEDSSLHEDQAVDTKLITLAKIMGASICTTDYNLGQVASLQKIEILNINELTNAVRPAVFIGEEMDVQLIREGREPHQAIAYMDDGTMIVVSDASALIGKSARVRITSVLQTQTGKMIFAELI